MKMDFQAFLILLVISVVVSAILHFGLEYYVTPGNWSFVSKVVVGWFGAWMGTPVFGRWFAGMNYMDIYYIPAAIGAFAALVVAVDLVSMLKGGSTSSRRRR
jgi:uncharacterized membrane protein YeaQ/YmgE (transglycosylase-associated protein family)